MPKKLILYCAEERYRENFDFAFKKIKVTLPGTIDELYDAINQKCSLNYEYILVTKDHKSTHNQLWEIEDDEVIDDLEDRQQVFIRSQATPNNKNSRINTNNDTKKNDCDDSSVTTNCKAKLDIIDASSKCCCN